MARIRYLNLIIVALALAFGITACAGGNQANQKRLDSSKKNELRNNWKDYTVFARDRAARSFQPGPAAILYKVSNDKKVLMDGSWRKVTTAEGMAKARVTESTTTTKILGYNDELYGYVVHRSIDGVKVKIIDENTVQLSYSYRRNYRL